jgi:hypothetical protein
VKYIESIDEMILWDWRKCLEGKHEYCRVDINKGTEQEDELFYDLLYDQYLQRFGLAKDYERILEIRVEMTEIRCEYCENGNLFLMNRVKVLEAEIEDIVKRSEEGMDTDDCLMYLSKWMGYRVDQKVITIVEFQTYLKAYEKETKALNKTA